MAKVHLTALATKFIFGHLRNTLQQRSGTATFTSTIAILSDIASIRFQVFQCAVCAIEIIVDGIFLGLQIVVF